MLNKLFSMFNRKKKVEVKAVSNVQKSDHKKKPTSETATTSQTSDTILLNPLNPISPIHYHNDDYDQKPTKSSNPYSSPAISDDGYGGGKSGGVCSPSIDSGGCGGGGGGD